MWIGLLTVLTLCALAPAIAFAATTVTVNETTDTPLSAEGEAKHECIAETSGKCTLRAALELAKYTPGGEITVELPSETFDATLGTLAIEPGTVVTIAGQGEGKTIIDGEKLGSVLEVEPGASLTLQKVTVRHGEEDTGGGIYVSQLASTTVEDSAIEENTAKTQGGGIYGEPRSSITIKHSRIAGNKAVQGGGGIYGSESDVTVGEQSTITDNEGSDGGGIDAEEGGEVTVKEESTITENTAGESGGGVSGYETSIAVEHSTITKNEAGRYGGGIDIQATEGGPVELTVDQSAIEENHSGEYGGGIYGEEAEVTVEGHSTIAHNIAAHHGGGIATFRESGGSCGDLVGELMVKQSTISDNTAGVDEEGDGGGIYAETSVLCDQARAHASTRRSSAAAHRATPATVALAPEEGGGLTVEQSTIVGNTAGYYGGGIYESGINADPIVNSTIADNVAGYEGGGIYTGFNDVAVLVSDTLSDNTTQSGDRANNLATADGSSEIHLRDTILAEEPGEHEQNCEGEIGPLISGTGYNLDYPSEPGTETPTPDTCGLSADDHDLVGVLPKLDSKGLQSNGGPTQTIALLSTSPAIGVVPVKEDCEESSDGPASVDQRGEPRPGIAGDGCDIGAYEYQEPKLEEPAKKEEPKSSTGSTTTPAASATISVLPFKVVSPPQCTSERDITIHIQNVKQLGIVSAVISIDGHSKRTLTGRHLTAAIDLVGLPKGTFTVEIVARTRSGRTLKGKRVYHTCHTKLPGHSYLPL